MSERRKVVPPLFDEAPPRECSRWLGDRNCGAEAFVHVLWSAETMDNGVVCTDHAAELDSLWKYHQAHELGPDCGMPGAHWFFEENECRVPDGPAASAAETSVEQGVRT